jgi:hypothetical protein
MWKFSMRQPMPKSPSSLGGSRRTMRTWHSRTRRGPPGWIEISGIVSVQATISSGSSGTGERQWNPSLLKSVVKVSIGALVFGAQIETGHFACRRILRRRSMVLGEPRRIFCIPGYSTLASARVGDIKEVLGPKHVWFHEGYNRNFSIIGWDTNDLYEFSKFFQE